MNRTACALFGLLAGITISQLAAAADWWPDDAKNAYIERCSNDLHAQGMPLMNAERSCLCLADGLEDEFEPDETEAMLKAQPDPSGSEMDQRLYRIMLACSKEQEAAQLPYPGESEIEILSKEDARTVCAMTRAQWVENVSQAVIAGLATAMGNPETGLSMATTTPVGELIVRPNFSGDGKKPDFILVTVGYSHPTSALLTDAALNDAIQESKRQMEPEYEVSGWVERIQDRAAVFFVITEMK